MQTLFVFAGLITLALGRPGFLSAPLAIAALAPGAPIGPDGRVVDTAEVAVAKAEHAVAHVNEQARLVNEAVRSGSLQTIVQQPSLLGPIIAGGAYLVPGAPVGPDGRVVDTAEVAVAKAAHAAAQVNERITLANEAARSADGLVAVSGGSIVPVLAGNGLLTSIVPGASIGPDGRVLDTPEVVAAKVAHAAAQVNERINLANEAVRSGEVLPVVTSIVSGAVVGPDGRVQDTPEVAIAKAAHAAAHINEKLNLANEAVRSGQVVAVAGSALPYGSLVY